MRIYRNIIQTNIFTRSSTFFIQPKNKVSLPIKYKQIALYVSDSVIKIISILVSYHSIYHSYVAFIRLF